LDRANGHRLDLTRTTRRIDGMQGCIDAHGHLLPGVDDGCQTLSESLECARALVASGYSHAFCTPHIWQSLPQNTPDQITQRVHELQQALIDAGIELKLHAGGEINLYPRVREVLQSGIMSFAGQGKFALADLWADKLEPWLDETIRWMQSEGLTLILAHPERMRAIQDDPARADFFLERGVLLQCNLQCIADAAHTDTHRTAMRLLREGKYFAVATDLHNPQSLPARLHGLHVLAREIDETYCIKLLKTNPGLLLPNTAESTASS
jgi:protein-tyrosine phosphatase